MAADRDAELKRLATADAHIAETDRAIAEQIAQLEALGLAGQDTAMAERELVAFEETLAVLQGHRATIVKAIEEIDAGL
jgi:hypothetical protein